ncbi:MAG TPA: hybrid sensor histidine kinase/response regulator [Anaerolineales bacterium]|nr:hybrid sensor histidine kinase/response regulator [Anaerolineales bacterium]
MSEILAETTYSILIIDDSPENLRLLSRMLMDSGYQIRVANGGQRAIEAAFASPPDLVLLDVLMPDMDGYEVCRRLRADPRTGDVPVIFISALTTTEDKLHAFTAGGVDYITKPFQSREVVARVKTHLEIRTLQKQLGATNTELHNKVRELESQNAELDAFAHTVAHDLKAPLMSLMFSSGVLTNPDMLAGLSPQQVNQFARPILEAARKMDEIIESLLMLAGVRKAPVEIKLLDMQALVEESLERLALPITTARAEIHVAQHWPPALGYPQWVEEVWVNYISNAIKYGGEPPEIWLDAEELPGSPRPAGRPTVRFWVRDNGPGLTLEEQKRLFTPFTRIHTDRAAGHGLGLSIVQRIVEKLGGEVGVVSQYGGGSTFFFTLPAAPQPTES